MISPRTQRSPRQQYNPLAGRMAANTAQNEGGRSLCRPMVVIELGSLTSRGCEPEGVQANWQCLRERSQAADLTTGPGKAVQAAKGLPSEESPRRKMSMMSRRLRRADSKGAAYH